MTKYVKMDEDVCVCVCLCELYSLNGWADLMKFHTNSLEVMGQCISSQIFDKSIWWRHGNYFAFFICSTLTAVIFVRFSSNFVTK